MKTERSFVNDRILRYNQPVESPKINQINRITDNDETIRRPSLHNYRKVEIEK